jgi:hypothetical protein
MSNEPLAQSFYVRQPGGMFASRVDLYFKAKDSTLPITVEIREMINGFPGPRVLPFSRITLETGEVNTDVSLGTKPTPFTFPSPVYLRSEQEYALVVRPAGNSTDYSLWVAQLGQNEINDSTIRVTKQAHTGILFTSSNDRTWTAREDEDLKFTLYRAAFDTTKTGTLIMTNENGEFFTIAVANNRWIGEAVHGEPRLTMSASASGNTGEYLSGGSSGANGVVTNIASQVYRIRHVNNSIKYTTSELCTFYFANGTVTGVTANLSSQTTPAGMLTYYNAYDSSDIRLHLGTTQTVDTTGTWVAGEYITGQTSNNDFLTSAFDTVNLHSMHPLVQTLTFQNAPATWGVKGTTTGVALDSSFATIDINEDHQFAGEKRIHGNTTEAASLSGNKSFQLQGTLTTTTNVLSPTIDLIRSSVIGVENKINNDLTGETGNGGNALAKYISRRVKLDDGQDAEDLKVYLTAYKPNTAGISVYYRILHAEDSENFEDKSWVLMTQSTSGTIVSDTEDKTDYMEYLHVVPTANLTGDNSEVQYTSTAGVTFTGFLTFAIKIVLTSSDTPNPPRVKDLRALAIQV